MLRALRPEKIGKQESGVMITVSKYWVSMVMALSKRERTGSCLIRRCSGETNRHEASRALRGSPPTRENACPKLPPRRAPTTEPQSRSPSSPSVLTFLGLFIVSSLGQARSSLLSCFLETLIRRGRFELCEHGDCASAIRTLTKSSQYVAHCCIPHRSYLLYSTAMRQYGTMFTLGSIA